MAATLANGANGLNGAGSAFPPARFSDLPSDLSIPTHDGEEIGVPLLEDIEGDPTDLVTLLTNEECPTPTWVTVAVAYVRQKKIDNAIDLLSQAVSVFSRARNEDKLSILNGLCWLYLLKCREAPRLKQDENPDVKTKDHYIQAATLVLNDARRLSPSYPPLFLANGVLLLLKAALKGPATTAGPSAISTERLDALKVAARSFEDALRASGGKNLLARFGKARVNYSMGKYAEALKGYQSVLESSPDLIDPDPRIGIGCCYWQLGFQDDAATAWQRSLELNPDSKVALVLLGVYNYHLTAHLPPADPSFARLSKKAVQEYLSPAMAKDKHYPLTCAALGSWFVNRRDFAKVEQVSKRAIELTDINAIASDGWYQLARKEHQQENTSKAAESYAKSDGARGGDERGYIPAKFGLAQMNVLMSNYDGAKFRLEKILQQQPTIEAQTLLGTLYAEDVFNAQNDKSTDDKSAELKKALKHLEDVQKAWRDPKRNAIPDQSVLLNLARLYETDHPDKSLKCLEEVEQMELDAIPDEDHPEDIEDEVELKNALREMLPPQLLNNMGCFHYQADRFVRARELFQAALNACVQAASRDETIDTDALVTSISYNLGRTYESEGMLEEAKNVYEGLLKRHADYVDARIRLTYISLRQSPLEEGPVAMKQLFKDYEDNVEVRALYGWYLNKSKKRGVLDFQKDDEQRSYKHTLQKFDKHDRYSLMGMGNILLAIAREMPRNSEQEKDKRRKQYEKAVEFFDKVLQLDPKNAYAAQGIAIALVEDKRDFPTALQILTKVKETLKDYSVYVNLGHTYSEVKQYARAIENYEAALSKDRQSDARILCCLGRTWYLRARAERNISAYRTALEYSKQALNIVSSDLGYQFNVAFIQFQIAQQTINLPETQRTLEEVNDAATGLTSAIDSLEQIAKAELPPFPKTDIVSRANMGRNTMVKQLERAREKQSTYEEENASKLDQARKLRDAEMRRREEEKKRVEEEAFERKRKILEEQSRIAERDRMLMEQRGDEERRRLDEDEDKELRKAERRARGAAKGGKRKKKSTDDSDTEGLASSDAEEPRSRRRRTSTEGEGLSDEERPRTKKRKLVKKNEPAGKFKSAEFIDDDSEEEGGAKEAESGSEGVSAPRARKGRVVDDEDEEDDGVAAPQANGGDVAMDEDEDE